MHPIHMQYHLSLQKLLSIVQTLSDCMNKPPPNLSSMDEDEEDETEVKKGLSIFEGLNINSDYGAYEDSETKNFYDDFPDLLTLVPLNVLGFSFEQAEKLRESWKKAKEDSKNGTSSTEEKEGEGNEDTSANTSANNDHDNDNDGGGNALLADIETIMDNTAAASASENDSEQEDFETTGPPSKIDILLSEKLPECLSKEKVDEFCEAFCHMNNKGARRKLAQALTYIPRNRLELVSYYARVLASLNRIWTDIAPVVLQTLRNQFWGSIKHKNQLYIIDKLKNVKYIGEMVKFKVAPPIVAFRKYHIIYWIFLR